MSRYFHFHFYFHSLLHLLVFTNCITKRIYLRALKRKNRNKMYSITIKPQVKQLNHLEVTKEFTTK